MNGKTSCYDCETNLVKVMTKLSTCYIANMLKVFLQSLKLGLKHLITKHVYILYHIAGKFGEH